MKHQLKIVNRLEDLALGTAQSDSLWAIVLSGRDSLAQLLVTKNAAVNATEQHEINEQVVNDIFLKTVAAGVDTFTSQQIIDLNDVAAQCPDCGGDAVFRSRSLLALHDPYAVFDDNTLCGAVEERSAQPGEAPSASGFQVYPNPAGHELTVMLPAGMEGTAAEVVVYALSGNEILRRKMPGDVSSTAFDISAIPAGAYFVAIVENGRKIHTKPVIILK